VDDVAENREVLAEMLTGLGCGVRLAGDGPECLAQVGSESPDIVFLDIRMPGMDGLEVARRMVTGARAAGVSRPRLVAVSASALAHERNRFAESDFDAFLAKPFRFEELCDCLLRLLPIRFRYGEAVSEEAADGDEAVGRGLVLPEALRSRIRRAAERYSATHLEEALTELAGCGAEEARWAGVLRRWLAAGRFEDIASASGGGGRFGE
jgi:CheY-like chemotaxis protein